MKNRHVVFSYNGYSGGPIGRGKSFPADENARINLYRDA